MELGTIRALSYVLELLRYQWQILSFVRCQNMEMKDLSKMSQNSHRLKRITWISDGVIQFLSNILPVSHFNPVKPAVQRQRYPCGKNPDWHVPPFIQGVVPHEFWEMINGKKIQIRLKETGGLWESTKRIYERNSFWNDKRLRFVSCSS